MPHPQPGIVPAPRSHALFLILGVCEPASNRNLIARTVSALPLLTKRIGAFAPRARLVVTAGFGPELWDILSPGARPSGFYPFEAINAGGRTAPGTGGDLLLHILSDRRDLNFELAMRIRHQLGDAVTIMEEVHGFRYLDSRDLTGFIDGTENPKGAAARSNSALIGDEQPGFECGTFAFTQRYVHDLKAWAALPAKEQEIVIGRRKSDSIELPPRAKPPAAHISRVVIEESGQELQIVRHSFPYGTLTESGLFFLAYCRSLDIPRKMLARMMGVANDRLHDSLMEYSRAVSGAHFFVPSLELLASLGRR